MKLIYKFVFVFFLLMSVSFVALANPSYGSWAEEAITSAITKKILKDDYIQDYYSPITRIELARLIADTFEQISDEIPDNFESFIDTDDDCANIVSALNIMNGYGDGTFIPNAFTTRQEMAKIILTYQSAITKVPLVLPIEFTSPFTDFNYLSNWAKPYVQKAYQEGFISGYADGSFSGSNYVSWQEAIVLIDRVFPFSNIDNKETQILCDDFNLNTDVSNGILTISWDDIDETKNYTLTITEQRLSRYENDIPPNSPLTINLNNESSYSISINPNKKYSITISCKNMFSEKTIYTEKLILEDMNEISANYPTTEVEAEEIVTEITVPIWKLSGNEKVPSEATFKVHNKIAQKVILVFEEIYNGDEQFPIKDVNAYTWRGGTTEHNGGTAIDINSNENYCIYNNGTIIGTHWKPYDDPYSITPYGDVVRAFEKYGFTWGADAWSNPKDYMHFSYLGT
ncbi:MAG: S-layer homology domain-containing protein [Clostridia bacterium]|nr:S-layer homology domain-containing protein [Clostridia bacterium]